MFSTRPPTLMSSLIEMLLAVTVARPCHAKAPSSSMPHPASEPVALVFVRVLIGMMNLALLMSPLTPSSQLILIEPTSLYVRLHVADALFDATPVNWLL